MFLLHSRRQIFISHQLLQKCGINTPIKQYLSNLASFHATLDFSNSRFLEPIREIEILLYMTCLTTLYFLKIINLIIFCLKMAVSQLTCCIISTICYMYQCRSQIMVHCHKSFILIPSKCYNLSQNEYKKITKMSNSSIQNGCFSIHGVYVSLWNNDFCSKLPFKLKQAPSVINRVWRLKFGLIAL